MLSGPSHARFARSGVVFVRGAVRAGRRPQGALPGQGQAGTAGAAETGSAPGRRRIGTPATWPAAWQEVTLMTEVVIPVTIRDLAPEDLLSCAWSGSATHLASIARALERARRGEVDYLAVCPPSGLPVALGGIDYAKTPRAGTLWQLALQSCGIGTILIQAAEQRIRARGLRRAELGVEECNPRARALYERLGYLAYGREPASWDEEASDGSLTRYETVCTLMRKELP
jgi:ribosomal protein S18 acetylase RimI-like enzyme